MQLDKVLGAPFFAAFTHPDTKVFYNERDGICIQEPRGDIFMFCFSDIQVAKRQIELISDRFDDDSLFMVVGEELKDIMEKYGYERGYPCLQLVYLAKESLPYSTDISVRPANYGDVKFILDNYRYKTEEQVKEVIDAGRIFVGEAGGEKVGFIGEHEEKSIGMLFVEPSHRKAGLGADLEKFMINRKLSLGEIPYCHVIVGNDASERLQSRLGLTKADTLVYWLWKS